MARLEYGNWEPETAWEDGYFWPQDRSIGGIIAHVTIEETERDDLTVTEHPIEQGAPIADHAFKRPSEVVIRAGWSTSGAGGRINRNGELDSTLGTATTDLSAASGIYGILLSWQAALKPFNVYTGKRIYRDMLMTSLVVTTDHTSEYALLATITCKQVILVSTTDAGVSSSSSVPSDHSTPSKTASELKTGAKNATEVGGAEKAVVEEMDDPTAAPPPADV
jgi:hypothetical protein